MIKTARELASPICPIRMYPDEFYELDSLLTVCMGCVYTGWRFSFPSTYNCLAVRRSRNPPPPLST